MSVLDEVHRFSNEEYLALAEVGALDGKRVELLDGLIVDMSPIGEDHNLCVEALMRLLTPAPRDLMLRVQMSLPLADGSVPLPDIAVTERTTDRSFPTEVLLVAEVAQTSHARDHAKQRRYARHGVPVYWLVDLPRAAVIEHTDPGEDGYAVTSILRGDDLLDPQIEGIAPQAVADLLGLR